MGVAALLLGWSVATAAPCDGAPWEGIALAPHALPDLAEAPGACGCTAAPGPGPAGLLALSLAVGLRRRRSG